MLRLFLAVLAAPLLLLGMLRPGRGPSTGLGAMFEPPPTVDVGDELRSAYHDDAQERGVEVHGARPFLEWAADVPEPKRPLDLDRFRFQRALYSEEGESARLIRVIKAAQVGVSAWLIRWALRRADLGATLLYIMPRERQATEFSTMRLKPVLSASAYLRIRQKASEDPTDTKRLKSIGGGFFAIRGSKSEDELMSVDADALALDEFDRLTQGNLPRVMQRVTGPMSQGLVREVSTPTLPNFGIAKGFAVTDQRRWHVRCGGIDRKARRRDGGCGEWNRIGGMETFLSLLDHEQAVVNDDGVQIDGPPIALRCAHCRRPLDVREGEWVAEFTDGQRPIGYHMPKFIVPGVNLAGVVLRSRATRETEKRAFHNEDLGEAWQSASAGLTDEQIAAAVRAYRMEPAGYYGYNPVTMGVDVAAEKRGLNVRISEHLDEHTKRALWIGIVNDELAPWGAVAGASAFEILTQILERFRVHMAVIDHMPDPRLVRAWTERHYGRAYRVGWSDNQKAVLQRTDPKEDPTKLSARYLEGMDSTLDLIRRQANLLPEDRPDSYDAHLKARVLSTVEPEADDHEAQRTGRSKAPVVRQAWIQTGPDDYLQAEAYDVIATHMMYVHRAQGSIGGTAGQVIQGPRPDVVDEQADDRRAGADAYRDELPEEPLSGW